jgi:hypothetical protein
MPSKGPHAQLSLSLPPLLSQESMGAGAEERWINGPLFFYRINYGLLVVWFFFFWVEVCFFLFYF